VRTRTLDTEHAAKDTTIEPGVYGNKHYAPGDGLISEEDMEGDRVELVDDTTP